MRAKLAGVQKCNRTPPPPPPPNFAPKFSLVLPDLLGSTYCSGLCVSTAAGERRGDMRSNGRRKSSGGPGKSNKSKHPWLVFCFFAVSPTAFGWIVLCSPLCSGRQPVTGTYINIAQPPLLGAIQYHYMASDPGSSANRTRVVE